MNIYFTANEILIIKKLSEKTGRSYSNIIREALRQLTKQEIKHERML